MGEETASGDALRCEFCGRTYVWKPHLAGRKVKCHCGGIFEVPPEAPEAPEAMGAFHVATSPAAPEIPAPEPDSPSAAQADAAAAAARMGYLIGRRKSKFEAPQPEVQRTLAPSPVREFIAPIGLILVGMALAFVEAMTVRQNPPASIVAAAPEVILKLILNVGMMLGGTAFVTLVLDVTFIGSYRRSILRFCAIAIAPCAVYGICTSCLGDLGGAVAGSLFSAALYGLLFWWLMRLDLADTATCVVLIFALVTLANYLAYKLEGFRRGSWM